MLPVLIEILAGTPVGGGQDRAARALAAALTEHATVRNLPGRGGSNAWDALLERRGVPDVAAISSPTIITNRLLGVSDIDDRDLTPLAQLCTEYLAFVVAGASTIDTPLDLIDAVAANQVTVALAVARGNINHIALGAVIRSAGGDPSSVAPRVFDSAKYAVAEVLTGAADLAIVSAASAVDEIEGGSLRAIATSSPGRLLTPYDGTPTWGEAGVDCAIGTWRGIVGPPDIGDDTRRAWDRAIQRALTTKIWHNSVASHRWTPSYLDASATRRFLEGQRAKLRAALVDLGVITW